MTSLHVRPLASGMLAYRVVLRVGGRQRIVTLDSAVGADELMTLARKVGDEAALAVIDARSGRDIRIPLLGEQLERHLTLLGASATPGTVADYRRMAARTWGPRLGELPLPAVTRDTIREWVAWQRRQLTTRGGGTRTYSPKSIANAHGLLSAVLAGAVEAGHIPSNPARGVGLPTDHVHEEMTALTEGEFIRVLGEVPAHFRPLVLTLVGTGMRWGEATALTVADLDLDSAMPVVRIHQAWKKGEKGVYLGSPKTRRGRRTVSLPSQVVDALRAIVIGKAPAELVFTSVQGKRIQGQHFREREWHPAVLRAGIGKAPRVHDLRHTHATWMIARGMNLTTLQRRLGHEKITTTSDTYGHLLPEAQTMAAASASLALAGWLPYVEPEQIEG
jgi:integrase